MEIHGGLPRGSGSPAPPGWRARSTRCLREPHDLHVEKLFSVLPSPSVSPCETTHHLKSAMNRFVSVGFVEWRLDAKMSFEPSGVNIGKPSNVSLKVICSRPVP